MQTVHGLNPFKDMRAERQAVFDGIGLHEIEQNLLQQMVFVGGFFPGHFIRPVFAIGEVFRHGATGATVGERKYRGACGGRVCEAIRVNGHKQVCAVLVGNLHAIVQRDKRVACARQAGVNAVAA